MRASQPQGLVVVKSPILHHEAQIARAGDIFEWIGIENDKIGEFAWYDAAE